MGMGTNHHFIAIAIAIVFVVVTARSTSAAHNGYGGYQETNGHYNNDKLSCHVDCSSCSSNGW
jgi:hypothetical protein